MNNTWFLLTDFCCCEQIGHSLRSFAIRTNKHKQVQTPPLVPSFVLKKQKHNEVEKRLHPSLAMAVVEKPNRVVVESPNNELHSRPSCSDTSTSSSEAWTSLVDHILLGETNSAISAPSAASDFMEENMPIMPSSAEYNSQFNAMNLSMLMNEPIGAIADTDIDVGDHDDIVCHADGDDCFADGKGFTAHDRSKSAAMVQELFQILSSSSSFSPPVMPMAEYDTSKKMSSSNPFEESLDLAQHLMDTFRFTQSDAANGTKTTDVSRLVIMGGGDDYWNEPLFS